MWFYPVLIILIYNVLAYSFVTVNCMSFIIFLCVTLKLFSLSFVPLFVANPGETTESERSSTLVTDYANVGADDQIM